MSPPSLAPVPEPIELEPPLELVRVPNSGLPCAVDDVLAAKCRRCHSIPIRHSAPFPLLTWEDLQQLHHEQPRFQIMAKVVQTGYMPYGISANPPVQPLTDAEKQTLVDWVEAGAPRATCGAEPGVGGASGARVHRKEPVARPKAASAPPPRTR